MMTSRTHPQKISTKFLTNKEESKEIGARAGFCEKLKNVKLRELVNPAGFALGKEYGFTTRCSKNHYKLVLKNNQCGNENQHKDKHTKYGIDSKSKTRRARGG